MASDGARQSGRTTRMLQEAESMSRIENVLVVMATSREVLRVRGMAPQIKSWTFAQEILRGKLRGELRGARYPYIYVDHSVSEFLTAYEYRVFDQELSMSGATIHGCNNRWETLGSEPDFQFTSF